MRGYRLRRMRCRRQAGGGVYDPSATLGPAPSTYDTAISVGEASVSSAESVFLFGDSWVRWPRTSMYMSGFTEGGRTTRGREGSWWDGLCRPGIPDMVACGPVREEGDGRDSAKPSLLPPAIQRSSKKKKRNGWSSWLYILGSIFARSVCSRKWQSRREARQHNAHSSLRKHQYITYLSLKFFFPQDDKGCSSKLLLSISQVISLLSREFQLNQHEYKEIVFRNNQTFHSLDKALLVSSKAIGPARIRTIYVPVFNIRVPLLDVRHVSRGSHPH